MEAKHHRSFQSCRQETLMQKYRPMRIPHLVLPTSWQILGRLQTCCEMRREEKPTRFTEWFIALIICSTFLGYFYAHHQELKTTCVLLPPMVCDALVSGCRRSGAG